MTRHRFASARAGISLIELLVALTLFGIIGLSILRTFTSQARITELNSRRLDARAVARAPINVLMSEARMVETGGGIASATATSVTLRVPVAMGIVCGASGVSTVVSLMPVDSVVLASAAISGHAWRQASGTYTYTEGPTTVAYGGDAVCAAASITTAGGGRTILVTPSLAVGATEGTPAFIYQRIRYEFRTSTAIAGRVGLWRTLEASGMSEELAAPYDSTSRFFFFRNNADTPDAVVPPLAEITGLQLNFLGASERPRFGRATPETSTLQTAVFFMNRND